MKARKRRLAHDQVARQVVAKQGQCAQHVVVVPVARVMAQLQLGVGVGKGAAHESLRAHVVQKPGQPAVLRTHAVRLIDPDRATRQRHHAAKGRGLAVRVHPHDRHLAAHTGHSARQHIALRARRAHFLHLTGLNQRRQRPRHRGLAGSQLLLQLGARQHPALAAQGLQNFDREIGGSGHELFNE